MCVTLSPIAILLAADIDRAKNNTKIFFFDFVACLNKSRSVDRCVDKAQYLVSEKQGECFFSRERDSMSLSTTFSLIKSDLSVFLEREMCTTLRHSFHLRDIARKYAGRNFSGDSFQGNYKHQAGRGERRRCLFEGRVVILWRALAREQTLLPVEK